jgi:hypothetical protein
MTYNPDFQNAVFEHFRDEEEWYREYPDAKEPLRNKKLRGYGKSWEDADRHCEMGAFVDGNDLEREVHWYLSTLLPTREMYYRYLEGWKNHTLTKAQRRYVLVQYRMLVLRKKKNAWFDRNIMEYLLTKTDLFSPNEKALYAWAKNNGKVARRERGEEIPDIFA